VTPAVLATALHGTRVEEPDITRIRLQAMLAEYGITRVANVTGLDRLGVPVYMTIRPNSRSLSVSQGKGPSDDAAWVSGVMEAIELWHAESPEVPLVLGSYTEIAARRRVVDVGRLPRRPGAPFHRDYRILWTVGVDLFTETTIHVPYALVHVNSVPPFPPGDESFYVTSNGLASGTVASEALVHALCEVVERDAVNRWQRAAPDERAARWIDVSTIDDHLAVGLLTSCDAAGFDVLAANATSAVGLPVIVCVLLDRQEPSDTLRGAAMGFGCHLRRDIAFVRALTEAAQSRLTLIAGSRDDLDRSDYEVRRRHQDGLAGYRALLGSPHRVSFTSLPHIQRVALNDQLDALLDCLRGAGVTEAASIELSPPGAGLAVVRVVVPGLLGPDHAH
jgi:YcaO-like protein with predicted kinase domain